MAFTVNTAGIPKQNRRVLRYMCSNEVANLMESQGHHGVAAVSHRYRDLQKGGEEKEGIFLVPNTEPENRLFLLHERTAHGSLEHPFEALPKSIRESDSRGYYGRFIGIWDEI